MESTLAPVHLSAAQTLDTRRAASFSKRPSNGASGWRGGRLPYFSNANRKKL